jgi:hypothetical protein
MTSCLNARKRLRGRQTSVLVIFCLMVTQFAADAAAAEPNTAGQGKPGNLPGRFILDTKPRWELGVGGGYFEGFDYPASRDPNRAAIVLPYLIFRSAIFRVGGGGVNAIAVENPRVKLDLSVGGSLNSNSAGNHARESMPGLDFLLEIGPQLVVRLIDYRASGIGRTQLSWNARVRAVAATDLRGIHAQGWVFASGFMLAQRRLFGHPVDLLANLKVTFADERLQDYFYAVPIQFETPVRTRFDARGGYLGTNLFAGISVSPWPRLRLFAGVTTGLYGGAANQDSPLFETSSSTGVVMGFALRLYKSSATVSVLETE